MEVNELSHRVIGCGLRVHETLGPGLLESAYEECLCYELSKTGIPFERQQPMPLIYEDVKLQCGYRIDILVDRRLVVEVKSVEALAHIHIAQVRTYLKLWGCHHGLLINFNVPLLKSGIRRIIR